MKKQSIKKTFDDFHTWLDHMEEKSKGLDMEQKESLQNILSVQITLLVMLSKASNLGEIKSPFLNKWFK